NVLNRSVDAQPLLFVMTDGKPSDTLAYSEVLPEVKQRGFAKIIACAAGHKADASALKRLTDTVVSLDTMDSSTFSQFFQWVSATVSANQQNNDLALPPPPTEINIVI
ncbi:MAG TPA: tellurium resistance protein TerY, partial [Agitococcus sp.]|nr:tellurium resistance protein TerY [Agitococcus sp.]